MSSVYGGKPANASRVNHLTVNGASGSPIAISVTAPHMLQDGARVTIQNVGGNGNANGQFIITVTGAATFTLNGTSSSGAYTSGGDVWPHMVQPAETIPSDGDDWDAATLNVPIENQEDQIQYLATAGLSGLITRTYFPQIVGVANTGTGFATTTQPSAVVAQGSVNTRDSAGVGGDYFDIAIPIPDGAVLANVGVVTFGSGSNNPSLKATYQLWKATFNGVLSSIGPVTNDSHSYGGGGNWLTTALDTVVSPTSALQVDLTTARYFLRVFPASDTGTPSFMSVLSLLPSYYLPVHRPA